jgi:hypothetical protein
MGELNRHNIKIVAQATGLSPEAIRAWETRYQAVTPERAETGRRLYSQSELERLRLLAKLVQAGHRIGNIARLADEDLKALFSDFGVELPLPSSGPHSAPLNVPEFPLDADEGPELSRAYALVLEALRDFQWEDLSNHLFYARTAFALPVFVLKIIAPMFQEVGLLVARGEMSVAQEHTLSATVRNHLGTILENLKMRPSNGHRIVFATQEGDLHEFGILLAAILALLHGHKVHYLGPNVPAPDLVLSVRRFNADIVVLGTSPATKHLNRISLAIYVQDVLNQLLPSVSIWMGGEGVAALSSVHFSHDVRFVPSLGDFQDWVSGLRK